MMVSSFLAGIFIDLDHIFDFIREHGKPYTVKRFVHICNTCQFDRLFIFLHAWEWFILLACLTWATGGDLLLTGVLIGYGHHMLLDALYNGRSIWSYWLIWRWKHGFDLEIAFGDTGNCKSRKHNTKSKV